MDLSKRVTWINFMTTIDAIKHEVSIMDALEKYTNANFTRINPNKRKPQIKCPFHDDHSPSFTVYTDTNTFRCWAGCNDGKSGDVIDIVKLAYNTDTKEAIKILSSDYGLSDPTGEQAKEWQKKKAERQRNAALSNSMKYEINQNTDRLRRLEQIIKSKISSVKTLKDLEQIGDMYHLLPQIEYWFDCLSDSDPVVQFSTLREIKKFFQDKNQKAGGAYELEKSKRNTHRTIYTR